MNEFRECVPCAAKPGSPTLCEACQHNRALINSLARELAARRLEVDNEAARQMLESSGWKVSMIGEHWSVGFGGRHAYSGGPYGCSRDGSVMASAREFVKVLREAADKLERDITP